MKKNLIAATAALFMFVASPAFAITNGDFEAGSTGWTFSTSGNFGRIVNTFPFNSFPISGKYGAIYSGARTAFSIGNSGQMLQSVDLTGISTIRFDAGLGGFGSQPENIWDHGLLASFWVNGVQMWSSNTAGNHFGVEIDVSGVTGVVDIAFRNSAVAQFKTVPSYWFLFDNVTALSGSSSTVVPVPAALPLGAAALAGLGLLARRKARAS